MHLLRQMLEKHLATSPADLVVLPEVFNGICDDDPLAGGIARKFLSTLARALNAAVIGGIDMQGEDLARRNNAYLVSASGEEVGVYCKRVMFGREIGSRRPGSSACVAEVAGVRVGVLICGDVWRAELVAELRDQVDLVCVCTKTTVPDAAHLEYARRLWWNLALTRAMENGLPIVVSDWAEGRHESTALADGQRVRSVHYTSGGASITDPGRRPDFDALQKTLPRGEPGILAATIDLDAVTRFRDYRRSIGLLS